MLSKPIANLHDSSARILRECKCRCGQIIPSYHKYGRERFFKDGHYIRLHPLRLMGENHGRWKGGIGYSRGYRWLYYPNHPRAINNKVFEHIVIMEKKLGRFLNPDEIVHHINHNRCDNRIENLQLMTKSEHSILHGKERKHVITFHNKKTHNQICLRCGSNNVNKDVQRANKKKRLWYCNKCNRNFTTISHSFIKWTKTGDIQMLSEQGYPYEILVGWKSVRYFK